MRHHSEVCSPLPFLLRVNLLNIVITHHRRSYLGQLHLGDVVAGAGSIPCPKLQTSWSAFLLFLGVRSGKALTGMKYFFSNTAASSPSHRSGLNSLASDPQSSGDK